VSSLHSAPGWPGVCASAVRSITGLEAPCQGQCKANSNDRKTLRITAEGTSQATHLVLPVSLLCADEDGPGGTALPTASVLPVGSLTCQSYAFVLNCSAHRSASGALYHPRRFVDIDRGVWCGTGGGQGDRDGILHAECWNPGRTLLREHTDGSQGRFAVVQE
jgi:hypothetical protein